MKKILLISLLSFASISAYAWAPPPTSWTGFYVGATGGYGWGDQHLKSVTFYDPDPVATFSGSEIVTHPKPDMDGAFGGLKIGYNYKLNNPSVLGLDASLNGSDFRASYRSLDPGSFTAHSKISWFSTVRAKYGFLVEDALMIYGTGGVAFGRHKASLHDNYTGYSIDTHAEKTKTGWVVGAGVEYPIYQHLTANVEYQHIGFGSQDYNLYEGSAGWDKIKIKASDKLNLVSVGLNYYF